MAWVELTPERASPLAMVHAHSAHFLDRLHHDDGRGGVNEDLEALQHFVHIRLTSQELLSYNNVFGSYRNISLIETKVTRQHG